jgi:hypothetical protein
MGALARSKVKVHHTKIGHMVKLIEECAGTGDLMLERHVLRRVRYRLKVFQGLFEGNGLPVPGLRTIEGSVDFGDAPASTDLVGTDLVLQLEDGRRLGIKIADAGGTICQRSHGGGACGCC